MNQIKAKMISRRLAVIAAVTAVYVFLSLLYFSAIRLPYKLVYPAAFLTLSSTFIYIRREMTVAFFLCAVGDFCGQTGVFVGQMGMFAAAHAMFIAYFARNWRPWSSAFGRVLPGFAVILLSVWAVFAVIVNTPSGVLRTGTAIYMLLILCMMYMACCQKGWVFGLGAVLFVFSDAVLAYNKFSHPVLHAGHLIMTTYYAALFCLFLGAVMRQRNVQANVPSAI